MTPTKHCLSGLLQTVQAGSKSKRGSQAKWLLSKLHCDGHVLTRQPPAAQVIMAELIFHPALSQSSANECNYGRTFYLILPHKGAATAVWLKDFPSRCNY